LDINNCTFINGSSFYPGGAINSDTSLNINNSRFINCYGNYDEFSGGAIALIKGNNKNNVKMTIDNSYFEKCKAWGAVGGFGGAIYIEKNTNAVLNNNTFCECKGKGVAIYNKGNTILNNSIIKNCIIPITTNRYNYYLGSILNDYGMLTVTSCVFENISCEKATFGANVGTSGIYNRANLDVSYSFFINNSKINNEMYDCVYTETNVKSLDYNFWGCDENPSESGFTNFKNIYYWFYLDISPEYVALDINESKNITAKLRLNNPNIDFDSEKLPKFNITFSSKVNDNSLYECKDLVNNSASILFNLTDIKGQYILFTGINGYSKPTTIDVGKNISIMDVEVEDICYGEELKINVSVRDNNSNLLNGKVSFKFNAKTYVLDLVNGSCNLSISNLNPGNYSLKVTYEGDEDYFKSIKYFNIAVNKIPTNLSISISDIFRIGQKAVLNTTLNPENFKVRAYLYINGNRTNVVYIYGGNTTISLGVRPVGDYNITIELWNHNYYESSSASASFKVEKYDVNLTMDVSDIKIGENATITINSSPNDFTGYATLEINDISQTVFIYNNQTNITVSNLNTGKYDIKLYYLGDEKFKSAFATASYNVLKNNISLDISVGEGFILVKTNYTDSTGLIHLFVNDKFYTQNLSNGVCNFTVEFEKGNNYIYSYYLGDDYYGHATANTTYFVPDTPGLTGEDLVVYEHSGEGYVINLNNELGHPIVNATISIEIGSKRYGVITNFEGYAMLPLNLDVGDYLLFASYKNFNVSNNISVKPINLRLSLKDKVAVDQLQTITAKVSKGVIGQIYFELSNNESYIVDINSNGLAQLNLTNLTGGNYTLKAYYSNELYNSSPVFVNFTVFKYSAPINVEYKDTLRGEDVIIKVTLPDDAKGNVTFIFEGVEHVEGIVGGEAILVLSDLDVAYYDLSVIYSGDDYYFENISEISFSVFKLNSQFEVFVSDALAGEDEVIEVFLDEDATGNVTFIVNGTEYVEEVMDGMAVLVLSNLKVDTYELFVNYSGDIHYNPNSTSLKFTIKTQVSNIDISVDDVDYMEKVIIKTEVIKGATGNVTFVVANKTKTVDIINSTATLELLGLNAGNYQVIAKYNGDSVYMSSQTIGSFTVNKAKSEVNIVVNSVGIGENIRIYAVVSPHATGNVTFRMLGYYSPRNKTIKDNNASWLISPLKTGQYTIIAVYNGDNNYLSSNTTYHLSVNQIETKLNVEINNVSKTSDIIIKATLKTITDEGINGQIMVTIGEYDYIINITEGNGSLNISKLNPGVYNYSAFYIGSKIYARSSFESSFFIEDTFKDVNLIVNPLVKYYSGDERLIMYLYDDAYNPISNASLYIAINDIEYKRTTNNLGMASMAVNLNSGNYSVNVRFEGFGDYNAASANSNITVNPTVEGLDVIKIFRNATQYNAIFCDAKGNLLKNTSVRFNINGIFYTRTTNMDGIASLNINLGPGQYILTAENPVTSELKSNLITVLPSIVENHDLNMYYRNGSQYVVKLLGSDGKAIAGEEVTFNINGVFYTRISNNEGYVCLNINLGPGTYIITAEYNGYKVSNNIFVKPVLFTNDLSFKYGHSASFEATLVDGHGKPYPNQIVTFNINGVIYDRTTNENGIASLNIRLHAGRYIITSSYNGCNVANTITIY
jgi:hypothetical protein